MAKGKPKKLIQPQEDLEYTFVYPGRRFYTFRFYCVKENGRLMFENVTTGNITDMSPAHFSYMCYRQLVSTRKVFVEKQKPIRIENEDLNIADYLKSLSEEKKAIAIKKTGYNPDDVAKGFINGVMSDWPDKMLHADLVGKYQEIKQALN